MTNNYNMKNDERKRVYVYLTETEKKLVKKAAAAEGVSLSKWITDKIKPHIYEQLELNIGGDDS